MNKYINTFSTISDYNANWDNILSPSVSYIKSDKKLIYDAEYTTSKAAAKVGWIAYDNNGITEYYNPKSTDVASLTSSNIIGIVVIPASCTEDGTVKVVSLDYMDYNNPTTGNTTSVNMYWGGYGSEVPNLPAVDKVVTYVTGTTTTALSSDGKFPSNYDIASISGSSDWTITVSGNDSNRKFISRAPQYPGASVYNEYSATPSPYNTDGSVSNDYFNTTGSILSYGLCGAENTDKIMADVTHTGDIQNQSGAGYHPAVECCRAYKDGSWYLPSQAELGYLCANLKQIDFARTVLERDSITGKYYWSSSQYSSGNAWYLYLTLNLNFGYCASRTKGDNRSVLAFVAL